MSDEWVGQEAHAPDVVGTVLGYRAWSVGELDGAAYLTSLVQKVMWPSDGPLVAQHQVEGQGALVTLSIFHLREQPAVPPVQGCQCGVYAYSSSDELVADRYYVPGATKIVGEVELWGKVAVHERGYRAQYARPRRLYWFTWAGVSRPIVEALAARYGVPVARDPVLTDEGV